MLCKLDSLPLLSFFVNFKFNLFCKSLNIIYYFIRFYRAGTFMQVYEGITIYACAVNLPYILLSHTPKKKSTSSPPKPQLLVWYIWSITDRDDAHTGWR